MKVIPLIIMQLLNKKCEAEKKFKLQWLQIAFSCAQVEHQIKKNFFFAPKRRKKNENKLLTMSHIVFHLIIIIFISLSCSSPPASLSLSHTQQCAIKWRSTKQTSSSSKKRQKNRCEAFLEFPSHHWGVKKRTLLRIEIKSKWLREAIYLIAIR